MKLKDHETPKKPWNVDLRVCPCYASHFQAYYDATNIFVKLGIKENLREKLKYIGEIEATPDREEVLLKKLKFAGNSLESYCPSKWREKSKRQLQ